MPLHSLYISWQRKIGARNFLDTETAKLGRDAVFSKSGYPSKSLACHLFPPAEAGAFRVGEDYLCSHKLWVKGIQLNDLFQLDISPPLGVMSQGKEWKEEFTWKHSQSTLCAYSSLTQWIIPFMDAVTSNIIHCGGFTHRGSVSQRKIILGMHMPHGSWESWEPNKKPFFDHQLLFNPSVMFDSLQPHGLQHTRLPCPSPSPRACSNSCPSCWWRYPTTSSSVAPFSSCPQSFPASGSFPMNWLFASGGQSIGASASASVFPMNIQGWFPLGLTGRVSLQSKGLSRVFYNTTVQKHQFFGAQPSLWCNSHIHTWLLDKP